MIAALSDENFENYSVVKDNNGANINTLGIIFNDELYNFNHKENKQNFLTKLVRSHIGGNDYATDHEKFFAENKVSDNSLLKDFGSSLKTISEGFKVYGHIPSQMYRPDIKKYVFASEIDVALQNAHDFAIAQAVEWHYHQDIKEYDGKEFVKLENSSIKFTTAFGDGILKEANRATEYRDNLLKIFSQTIGYKDGINYQDYGQYTYALTNDKNQINAIDKNKTQVLLTLSNGVNFKVGDKNDLVFGYHGDDILNGEKGLNKLIGGKGNDFLQGGSGVDVVLAGAGNDVVLGDGNLAFGYQSHIVNGLAQEHIYEKNGWETQRVASIRERKPESFEWEAKLNNDKTDYELTTKIETRNDEHIVKYDIKINYSDLLYGGWGNDLLIGQYGDDSLHGEDGDDVLYGDDNRDESIKGNDYLSGGAGNDKLIGGRGKDVLVGGTGTDEYVFRINDFDAEKTIIDEDNLGKIIIDNQNLANFTWEAVENITNKYTNSQGLFLVETAAGLIITNNQNININVEVNKADENTREILGIKLPEKAEETKPKEPPELKPEDGQNIINTNSLFTTGTFGNDFITPNIENINKPLTINSLTGNDTVTGSNANDIIRLGAGNDIVQACKGNDKLLLGSGITAQNILLEKIGLFGMDLTINILDFNSNNQAVKTNDKVTVQGYFGMPNQKIEELQLSTGEKLVGENINNLAYKTDNISLDKFKDNDFLNEVNNYLIV